MVDKDRIHLSLSGAGFLGIYHLGVIRAFELYFPDILKRKIVGTSAGSMAAAGLCSSMPMCVMLSETLKTMNKARSSTIGILNPNFNLTTQLKVSLRSTLTPDAYRLCSGRLFVSLTRWRSGRNELISHFESNEDLIEALVSSSHIPIFSGFIPSKFRGKFYWDGGMSNNCPRLDAHTITVCPYSSPCVDICPYANPKDASNLIYASGYHFHRSMENLDRCHRALFPEMDNCFDIVQSGYEHAYIFMLKEGIISVSISSMDPSNVTESITNSNVPQSLETIKEEIDPKQSLENGLISSKMVLSPYKLLAQMTICSKNLMKLYDIEGLLATSDLVFQLPYWIGTRVIDCFIPSFYKEPTCAGNECSLTNHEYVSKENQKGNAFTGKVVASTYQLRRDTDPLADLLHVINESKGCTKFKSI